MKKPFKRPCQKKALTPERVREVLDYHQETGIFRWKIRRNQYAKPGMIAGTRRSDGYDQIGIDGCHYLSHHLAWFYHYGKWPDDEVDHRDTDRLNNAISNLREATSSQNKSNSNVRRDNTTGFKGVSKRAGSIGYQAKITILRKQIHLGYFRTPEEAHAAYTEAANDKFKAFARVS